MTQQETVPLKEYIDKQFELRDIAIRAAHASMESRLEGMNEFRGQLKDQNLTFITRAEHDAVTLRNNSAIEDLKRDRIQMANIQAKLWIVITAGGALAILLFSHLSGKIM